MALQLEQTKAVVTSISKKTDIYIKYQIAINNEYYFVTSFGGVGFDLEVGDKIVIMKWNVKTTIKENKTYYDLIINELYKIRG